MYCIHIKCRVSIYVIYQQLNNINIFYYISPMVTNKQPYIIGSHYCICTSFDINLQIETQVYDNSGPIYISNRDSYSNLKSFMHILQIYYPPTSGFQDVNIVKHVLEYSKIICYHNKTFKEEKGEIVYMQYVYIIHIMFLNKLVNEVDIQ